MIPNVASITVGPFLCIRVDDKLHSQMMILTLQLSVDPDGGRILYTDLVLYSAVVEEAV
jgi:hypothetical protein